LYTILSITLGGSDNPLLTGAVCLQPFLATL